MTAESSADSRTKMSAGFKNLSFVDPFSHSDYSLHMHIENYKQVKRFSLKISRAKTYRQYNFCRDMMAYFTKNQESTKIYFFHKKMFSSNPPQKTKTLQFKKNYECVTASSVFLCKQRAQKLVCAIPLIFMPVDYTQVELKIRKEKKKKTTKTAR